MKNYKIKITAENREVVKRIADENEEMLKQIKELN